MIISKFSGLNSEKVFNAAGGTNWSEGNVKFQQDVKHLLETPLGSMLGNLSYGSNVYQMLFLPITNSTGTLLQEEIKRTIESNYGDIVVQSVDITFDKKNNKVYADIGISNGNSTITDYVNVDFERSGEF